MIKRCKLSEISDYLMGFGKSLVEKEDLSYEAAIRKMEYKTEKFIDSRFDTMKERDEIYGEIASRESVIKEIYFQLGLIAGINLTKDFEKRFKELNQLEKRY